MSPSRRIVPWPCVMRVRILSRNARAYPTRDDRTCKAAHRAMRRGGAMGTSRPTAMPHEWGHAMPHEWGARHAARVGGTATAHEGCVDWDGGEGYEKWRFRLYGHDGKRKIRALAFCLAFVPFFIVLFLR